MIVIQSSCAIGAILSTLLSLVVNTANDTTLEDDVIRIHLWPTLRSVVSTATIASVLELNLTDDATQSGGAGNSTTTPLFGQYCSKCHGRDGTGSRTRKEVGSTPDFTKASWQSKRTDKALRTSIAEGKGTRMPAFGELLSENEIDSLIVMIRGFAPKTSQKETKTKTSGAASSDSFADRFQDLENQLEELRRQFWALSPQKPGNRSAHGPP
jgi:mono/diheme cytochrome c family protein